MVLVPFYVFAIAAASMSDDGSLIRMPLWGCVGGFVGYCNSGWAMDAVAGKLPKDGQSPPYKNIVNSFTPLIVRLRVGNRFLSRPALHLTCQSLPLSHKQTHNCLICFGGISTSSDVHELPALDMTSILVVWVPA